MSCDHYKKPCPHAGGKEDGAAICFHCSQNTAKGQWPTRESLPLVPLATRVVLLDGPAGESLTPIPYRKWPWGYKLLAGMRQPEDVGLGDTVHRLLAEKGEEFKADLKRMGIECGCSARQAEMNARYPY